MKKNSKILFGITLTCYNIFCLNNSQDPQKNIKYHESNFEQEAEAESGIDNFEDQDGGNWYEKRILLKKAGPKRNKISKKVADITKNAQTFVEKRNLAQSLVKQALVDFGFTVSHLDEQINSLSAEIDETRKKEGLNEQERSALDEVVKNKADLDQLKTDVSLISQLDESLGKALEKLSQQIHVAAGYEEKALELYDAIADILDDKKAKSYYLQIETLLDNVEAIERYINTQFTNYIDNSTNTIKELIEKVKKATKELQDRGVIITKQFEEAQKAEHERLAKEKAAKKVAPKNSRLDSVSNFFSQVFSYIAYPFVWLYQLIFGK